MSAREFRHHERPGALTPRFRRVATLFAALSLLAGCDGESQLNDLDRGTDHRPGVKESPIEEGS